MSAGMTRENCSGCYNEDYHHGLGGAKECWSFSGAKLIKRLGIPVDLSPPYDREKAKLTPDCYRKQKWVFVKPEVLDEEGYWKQ